MSSFRSFARGAAATVLTAGCTMVLGLAPAFGTTDEAERQYRIGRRLAIERSAEAVPALRRVIELDPGGPLADDARVDLARYFGAPAWPEELGAIQDADLATARSLLDKVIDAPEADRSAEARYYRGLLWLEPYPGRNPATARMELVALATRPDAGGWGTRARYASAVLAEREGDFVTARSSFQRVLVDDPAAPAAARARVGLARLALIQGDPGAAAEWAQQAIDDGVGERLGAEALREAALRLLLDESGRDERLTLLAPGLDIRVPTTMSGTFDGGVVVGGQKSGVVVRLDASGRVVRRWTVPELRALATSPGGEQLYAATDANLVALQADGATRSIADLGEFASPAGLALDGLGRFWVVDRKGQRVGRVDADQRRVVALGSPVSGKLAGLSWTTAGLVALDTKSGVVLRWTAEGMASRLVTLTGSKPVDLAVRPDGAVAVLDGKTGNALVFAPSGAALGSRAIQNGENGGPVKPTGIAYGPDGALMVFDSSNAAWWSAR